MVKLILTMLVTISMIAVGYVVWRLLERQEERIAESSRRAMDAPQDADQDDADDRS